MLGRTVSIGELSERTGTKVETIRYYERIGLLPAPPRTEGGHRVFGPRYLKRLLFVRRSRHLGFSLDETRQMLRLVDDDTLSCEQVLRITLNHLASVKARIADLRRMERTLKQTANQCTGGGSTHCPIIDALSRVEGEEK